MIGVPPAANNSTEQKRGQRLSSYARDSKDEDDLDLDLDNDLQRQQHQKAATTNEEKTRKCSCGGPPKPTFYERKPNLLRSQKEKRDAATSPQLPSRTDVASLPAPPPPPPASPSAVPAAVRPSPRREIPMRNAATSPQREMCNKATTKSPLAIEPVATGATTQKPRSPLPAKIILEKSKSVSETRQARPLRTTRSLSPRPPIRHQQAIIVSDENDIILKVLPPDGGGGGGHQNNNFDDDDEVFHVDRQSRRAARHHKNKAKAQSENTSPNISKCDASFFCGAAAAAGLSVADDRTANNRSTGCLVYVPSDPWMKQPQDHRKKSATLVKNSVNDPWIYRRTGETKVAQLSRQQSKSMSSHIDNNEAAAAAAPLKSENLIFSPAKTPLPPPPPPPVQLTNGAASAAERKKQAQNFLLNVVNQNVHLQPRHSFSTLMPTNRADDELQLNIRRLSEQIKSPIGYGPAAPPSLPSSTYLNELLLPVVKNSLAKSPLVGKKNNSAAGAAAAATVVCIEADLVLETTC